VQSLILPVTAIVEGQVALAAGTAAIGTVVNNTDGPVAPGAAATKSALVGAEYTSASPAPTTGQQLALQVDALGNLRVNNTGGIGSFKIVISSVGTGTVPPVLTVPALTKYRLKAARVLLNSSSTTGNRMIGLIVTDNLANQLFSLVTPANTVASASNAITFGPSLPLGTAFVNNNTTVPIPEVSLGPGYTVAAEIVNGVSTDAVTLVINVEQYSE
jgi:hypothetical protein